MGLNSPLPTDIDARARASGATIATLRDLIPKECHRIEARRSWGALLVAYGPRMRTPSGSATSATMSGICFPGTGG